MALTVDGLQLYGADESTVPTQGAVNVTSVPSEEEPFLYSLTANEQATVAGRATGIRLSGLSAYSSDPETALAEWVQEFVSLVNSEQGSGYTVADDERDRSVTATATACSWTRAQGAPFQALWEIDLQRGDGVATTASRSPTTQSPGTTETLGGTDLGTILEKRVETQVDVDTIPLAFSPTSETVIVPQSGTQRRITVSGRAAGTQTELESKDDTLRGYVGDNQQLTYQTAFPGTSHEVVVDTYESTINAGSPSLLEYNLQVIEGLTF